MTKKRVLVACEWSQEVAAALRERGIEAVSCDLDEPAINPDWHHRGDVRDILADDWHAVLAFPPCTHLATSGARWFPEKRKDGRQQQGIDFFMLFADHPAKFVCIENPIGIMSTVWRKPDQIVHPWQFGHGEKKATCLWLKGLPLLEPTDIVDGRKNRVWLYPDVPNRSKMRGKTYSGIARAMAEQWERFLR